MRREAAFLNPDVSFLTWNIYRGADLAPLIPVPTPAAVTQVFRQFLATNFPVRAKAIGERLHQKNLTSSVCKKRKGGN